MSILCIGDSLTRGQVGYSYLPFLKTQAKYKNAGKNGDTILCMTDRLKEILEGKQSADIDTVIVGIGTNDLLLPYLTDVSPLWKMQMSHRCKKMCCVTEDDAFILAYRRVMQMIFDSKKRGIILGIPRIQLKNFPNQQAEKRNKAVKKLAQEYGFSFLDTNCLGRMILANPPVYSWKGQNVSHFADSALMGVIPQAKEVFTCKRNLVLTVDGVHFSRRMAKTLAACIDRLL